MSALGSITTRIPPDNYTCFSYKGEPSADQAQYIIAEMHENTSTKAVGIDARSLLKNHWREGEC